MLTSVLDRVTGGNNITSQIKRAVERLQVPEPIFRLDVGWGNNYDDLFQERFTAATDVFALVGTATSKGYVLLAGKGGGAKTVVVYRLAKHLLREKVLPIVVTLKDWTGRDYETWNEADSQAAKVDFLLRRFGIVSLRTLDLEQVQSYSRRLLLIDGLNEVNSRTGQEIIYALEEYVRFAANSAVIVTDRMLRRSFINPQRWRLALMLPVSAEEIKTQITRKFGSAKTAEILSSDKQDLLSSPYFLNAFLEEGQIAATKSEEFRAYFLQHVFRHSPVAEQELDLAANAAFRAYRSSSRTFNIADFEHNCSPAVVQKLKDSTALITEHDVAYFDHHLKHDYLASRYLSRHRDDWTSATFRVITFDGSSFETIMLTLEQIETSEAADYFVRQVYDWHPYGAGYAIAEARKTLVSREMQVVILAMLAERRLDIMVRTAEKAADTLSMMRTDVGVQFQDATTLSRVFEIVEGIDSQSQWFLDWRELYTRKPNAPASDADINLLRDPDSVLGWTASNVLKRMAVTDEQQHAIRELLRIENNDVVRWRAAHVLGSFPNKQNVDALISGLNDLSSSVLLGCVRSLVEIAARDQRLSISVFHELASRASEIAKHRSVAEEVQRAVIIRRDLVQQWWTAAVLPLISALQGKAESPLAAEQWDRISKKLLIDYGSVTDTPAGG